MTTTEPAPHAPTTWQAPDAAVWELETAHGTAIPPVILRDQYETAFAEGFRKGFAVLGVPLSHIELRHVNGWPYTSVFLHDVPRKAGDPPPDFVLKAITRLHPGFRRRTKIARTAIAEDRAQRFATDWFAERDRWIGRLIELQRDDLDELDEQELAARARAVAEIAVEGLQRHFELVPGCIPLGEWLDRAARWGLDPGGARRAVMHSTPVHDEAANRLDQLVDALGGAVFSSFDDIRRHSAAASEALDDYIDHHGWWATEDSFTGRQVRAFPASIMASIRADRPRDGTADQAPELLATLRSHVPAADRAEFDRLAEDAHRTYMMLDDNSGILGSWPAGLAGHVLRAVGDRLADLGRLHNADHVWALEFDDAVLLLDNHSALGADDAAGRFDQWTAQGRLTPPPHLNGPAGPPPEPGVFPGPVAQLITGMTTFLADKFNYTNEAIGIGSKPVRGRAVVAADASDAIDRIGPGDILITGSTTPAYNAILPVLGGIIVTDGGASCHAAIMARELNIPAIVGYADALSTIPEGAIIELDPAKATVRLAR